MRNSLQTGRQVTEIVLGWVTTGSTLLERRRPGQSPQNDS